MDYTCGLDRALAGPSRSNRLDLMSWSLRGGGAPMSSLHASPSRLRQCHTALGLLPSRSAMSF
jgi:hypothetical protein